MNSKLPLIASMLGALTAVPALASPKVLFVCETAGEKLTSRFAVYDRDARTFLVEWVGNSRPVDGYAPLFSKTVSKSTVIQVDTGGQVLAEDPDRVKIQLDLNTGKGLMKYYKWHGYKSSLFTGTADLKLEAAVVCEKQ
jgi:hypothetical protein